MSDKQVTLFVGDLSIFCTEEDIREAFSPYGELTEIKIIRCEETKKNLSYGFVRYKDTNDAEKAIEGLNATLLCGRPMRIGWASRRPRTEQFLGPSFNQSSERSSVHVTYTSNQIDCVVTEEFFVNTFRKFGEVIDAAVKRFEISEELHSQKGYGFVHFAFTSEGIASAIKCCKEMHNATIDQVTYKCNISHRLRHSMNFSARQADCYDNSQFYNHQYVPMIVINPLTTLPYPYPYPYSYQPYQYQPYQYGYPYQFQVQPYQHSQYASMGPAGANAMIPMPIQSPSSANDRYSLVSGDRAHSPSSLGYMYGYPPPFGLPYQQQVAASLGSVDQSTSDCSEPSRLSVGNNARVGPGWQGLSCPSEQSHGDENSSSEQETDNSETRVLSNNLYWCLPNATNNCAANQYSEQKQMGGGTQHNTGVTYFNHPCNLPQAHQFANVTNGIADDSHCSNVQPSVQTPPSPWVSPVKAEVDETECTSDTDASVVDSSTASRHSGESKVSTTYQDRTDPSFSVFTYHQQSSHVAYLPPHSACDPSTRSRCFGSAGQHHTGEGSLVAMIRSRSKCRTVLPTEVSDSSTAKIMDASPPTSTENIVDMHPALRSPTMCTSEASAIDSTVVPKVSAALGSEEIAIRVPTMSRVV